MQKINLILIGFCCAILLVQSSVLVDSVSGRDTLVRQKREAKPIFVFPGLENLQNLFNLSGKVTKTGTVTITFGASANKTGIGSKEGKKRDETTTSTPDDSSEETTEGSNEYGEEPEMPSEEDMFPPREEEEERRLVFNRRG